MIRPMPQRDRTLVSFGRNIARLRGERGLSQDKLAEKADLDRTGRNFPLALLQSLQSAGC